MQGHKDSRACPSCSMPIPRKSFKAMTSRCVKCMSICCSLCMIDKMCINCHIESLKHEARFYFIEKYKAGVNADAF